MTLDDRTAPEAIRDGGFSQKSDVWSFGEFVQQIACSNINKGVIMWQMIERKQPFENVSTAEATKQIARNVTPVITSNCPTGIPSEHALS